MRPTQVADLLLQLDGVKEAQAELRTMLDADEAAEASTFEAGK